jgi:hypothetical protein
MITMDPRLREDDDPSVNAFLASSSQPRLL